MIEETQYPHTFVRDSLVNILDAETSKLVTSLELGDMRRLMDRAYRLHMAKAYVEACIAGVDDICDPTDLLGVYKRPILHYATKVLRAAQFFGSKYFSAEQEYLAKKALNAYSRRNSHTIESSLDYTIFKDLTALRTATEPYAVVWCFNVIAAALSMWGYSSADNLILKIVEAKKYKKGFYYVRIEECLVIGYHKVSGKECC